MIAVTKFRADDGREFDSESEAVAHESCLARVRDTMAEWPLNPDGGTGRCDFANGGGYVQLSESLVMGVRSRLLDIIAESIDHKWVTQSREDATVDPSWVGRLLDDYDHCARSAWYRLACVDRSWRWWGQPYFAINPGAGKQAPFTGQGGGE